MLSNSSLNSLVFIDSAVDDHQTLATGVVSQTKAIVLNSHQDGIEQITKVLANTASIQSIHIIAHGQPGELLLGSAKLALNTIDRYVNQFRTWAEALGQQAEILLYGCNVAAGSQGATFLKTLNQMTGAHIAGSSTRVGSKDLGGNWDLDVATGAITASLALRPEVMENYAAVFAVPNQLYAVSGANIFTVNLSSAAADQVGTLQFPSFSLARQAATGFVYYISTELNNPQVAYWNPATGTNTIVGNTGTNGVQFLKLAQAVDGRIYGMDSSTEALYRIDPATGAATNLGTINDAVGIPIGFTAGSGDIAFDPTDPNRLFILTTGANFYRLYAVDITTLTATYLGNAAGLSEVGSGSLAFGQNGQLYSTFSGELYQLNYQLNQVALTATRVGASSLQFGDFATLPTPTEQVDLQVTKTDGLSSVAVGSQITYTITVTNPANSTVQGINLQDIVPAVVTGVTWSATAGAGVTFPTAADQSGTGNTITSNVNLAAGTSVVYTVRGTVSASATPGTTLTNQVTVSLPPGLNDPNPGNNTGTDITTFTPPNTPPGGGGGGTPPGGGGGTPPGQDSCKRGARIRGTNVDNRLVGTPDADWIRGFRGNDRIFGRDCGDLLIGNLGNDWIVGGGKRDRLRGNQGRDMLYGNQGRDQLNGGLGNDILDGGIGGDRLRGGRGGDRLVGNSGDDFVVGGSNNDFIQGNNGRDRLFGNQGNDEIRGHAGQDDLRGGLGNDDMTGGTGADRLRGGRGNDSLQGNEERDVLFGNFGRDLLSGGPGADRLNGGFGRDILRGGGGADFLRGGIGNDRLNGRRGADTLVGFWGRDVLIGGSGGDRFTYTGLRDRGDRIVDFTVGQDVIDLSRMINDTLAQSRPASDFVRFTQVGANTLLQVSVNGTGAGFVSLATLSNVTASSLTAASVIL